jgi:hypothetical protein
MTTHPMDTWHAAIDALATLENGRSEMALALAQGLGLPTEQSDPAAAGPAVIEPNLDDAGADD